MVRPALRASLLLTAVVALSGTAFAGATASAFKKETKLGANYWNAQSAIDGNLATCWMVPGGSQNKGEWIMLEAPKSKLDKLSMVIGWAKSESSFKDYARVKTVKIEVYKYDEDNNPVVNGSAEVSFEDKPGLQTVDVPDLAIGDDSSGGKVRLTITDFYPGDDFPNIGVSEVLLNLTEFDADPVVKSASSEEAGHDKGMMADKNAKTFWAGSSADATFSFEAAGFSLSQVGIQPTGKDWDRVKKVEIVANGRSVIRDVPDNATAISWIEIPSVVGYTGSAWGTIEVKVLETYPGAKNAGKLGITELKAKATAYEGI